MTLLKTSFLSVIATGIKMITSLLSIKVISLYLGPTGLAFIGQMQSFIGMVSNIASAGVNNGVIKYTAEHFDNEHIKQKVWSSALRISFILITPLVIAIIFLADFLSMKILNTTQYSSVFIIFAVTLALFVLNSFLTSVLNGQKEIRKLTLLNIISSLFGLGITIFLVITYEFYGALLAGIISQSVIFFITLAFVFKSHWFRLTMFLGNLDREYRNNLLRYTAMSFVSALMIPISHMYIRDYIGTHLGWDQAGYWQAIWRISETYLILITTVLSIYYLPKLSSIQDKNELKVEILKSYKIIMPLVIMMAFCIYIFKDLIITILFTKDFSPIAQLFFYQLIGDILKIAAWLLALLMIAKAMTKLFIFSEILFVWSFVALSVLFINIYGLIGVTIAFMINYFLYLVFVYFSLIGYLKA